MLIVNGGVYTEIEETKIDEYKSKGWVLASDYNQLEVLKAQAEAQQGRLFELMGLKKDEQVDLITSLGGIDDGRGTAEDRIRKILELEKGI
jgi:hypothetical protein